MQRMSLQNIALHPQMKVMRIPDEVYLVLRLAAEGKPVSKGLAIKARVALAAWPDELVFKGMGPFAGCLIRENKSDDGKLTPAQKVLFADLAARGITGHICHGLEANLDILQKFEQWHL